MHTLRVQSELLGALGVHERSVLGASDLLGKLGSVLELGVEVGRRFRASQVIDVLTGLMIERGTPCFIRSDNGPEFVAKKLTDWLDDHEVKTLFIEPGSPWQNAYVESFNGKLRDELLNCELFYSVAEARVLADEFRTIYNTIRPHAGLKGMTPSDFAAAQRGHAPAEAGWTLTAALGHS